LDSVLTSWQRCVRTFDS